MVFVSLTPKKNKNSKLSHDRLQVIEQQPHYFKHLKNVLEVHRLKAQSIDMRNKIRERQNRLNYTLELERINGILSQTSPALRHDSVANLKLRKQLLESLGAEAIQGIN